MILYEKRILLLSVDFEDPRYEISDGMKYSNRVSIMTEKFLDYFAKRNLKATFFIAGHLIDNNLPLLQRIESEGHEIGCHTYAHKLLDKYNLETFSKDLTKFFEVTGKYGFKKPIGFRAPSLTINKNTRWVYNILPEFGFKYSSSVLPSNILGLGWNEVSRQVHQYNGIWEIPLNVYSLFNIRIPFSGGMFFRVIPSFILKRAVLQNLRKGYPLATYFHPYEADYQQERYNHVGTNNILLKWLMYYNRKNLFAKIDFLLDEFDVSVMSYGLFYYKFLA
jgi:polysaccharide deacetylase family protein (PEP-CTERM system associated)